jgi:hypothetical protein
LCGLGGNFATSQVRDQLTAQQIYFPAAGSPALKALPAADAAAMSVYAGQQLTTGVQAETYAEHFIAVHLNEIAGGQTYAQVSAAAQAAPTNTKLAGQVATLFKGSTLRGLLLNSYGAGRKSANTLCTRPSDSRSPLSRCWPPSSANSSCGGANVMPVQPRDSPAVTALGCA